MADNKLILHPQDSNVGISDFDGFINKLHKIGFLGKKYAGYSYQSGDKFLDWSHFVESRHALLLGQNGIKGIVDNYLMCSVYVIDYRDKVSLHGANGYLDLIRCPACGTEYNYNVVALSEWHDNPETYRWQCKECHKSWQVSELDWQNGCAFTRCAIDIWGVHLNEAIPTQPFLEFLKKETGGDWTYFYYRV